MNHRDWRDIARLEDCLAVEKGVVARLQRELDAQSQEVRLWQAKYKLVKEELESGRRLLGVGLGVSSSCVF